MNRLLAQPTEQQRLADISDHPIDFPIKAERARNGIVLAGQFIQVATIGQSLNPHPLLVLTGKIGVQGLTQLKRLGTQVEGGKGHHQTAADADQ